MDRVWIVFNEEREVIGVCGNPKAAEELVDAFTKSAYNREFYSEEHEVEN